MITETDAIEAFRKTMMDELPRVVKSQIDKALVLIAADLEDEAERRREVARHSDSETPFHIADGISIAAQHVRNRAEEIEVVMDRATDNVKKEMGIE